MSLAHKAPENATRKAQLGTEKPMNAGVYHCPHHPEAALGDYGEIMEVLATDSGTQKDLPAWAKKMGHEYLGFVDEAGYMKLFVKRLK